MYVASRFDISANTYTIFYLAVMKRFLQLIQWHFKKLSTTSQDLQGSFQLIQMIGIKWTTEEFLSTTVQPSTVNRSNRQPSTVLTVNRHNLNFSLVCTVNGTMRYRRVTVKPWTVNSRAHLYSIRGCAWYCAIFTQSHYSPNLWLDCSPNFLTCKSSNFFFVFPISFLS